MSVIIKTETSITIDGKDYNSLTDICELVRRRLDVQRWDARPLDYSEEQMLAVRNLMSRIFGRE